MSHYGIMNTHSGLWRRSPGLGNFASALAARVLFVQNALFSAKTYALRAVHIRMEHMLRTAKPGATCQNRIQLF
jgi:hypothetical protein